MRLIDADALPRHGNRGGLVHWKDIENAPTIDPVKHGEWIAEPVDTDTGEDSVELVRLRCSACWKESYITGPSGPWKKYCPICGARMDGGEE